MRSQFDEQLDQLNKELITMGSLCEAAIGLAARALIEGDQALARQVPELSARIDQKERDIEGMCLKLLLQQQPVAKDLRSISSALKMVTDMERIGDQSADIAEIITLANITPSEDTAPIQAMARATQSMVTESIDAFVQKDLALAGKVVGDDDRVDACFDQVKKIVIQLFSRQATHGEYAVDLLMIGKYFERIGDHAVNIAQWVIFSITGRREADA